MALADQPPTAPAPAVACDLPGFFGETITSVLPTEKYASSTYKVVISTAVAKKFRYRSALMPDSNFVHYTLVQPGEPWLPVLGLDPRPMRDTQPTESPPHVPVAALTAAQANPVLSGATPFYVVVASVEESLLAAETDVFAAGTLRECLTRQKNLLRKYQNIMIAECKIIPELAKP